jgi:hypothetical protein
MVENVDGEDIEDGVEEGCCEVVSRIVGVDRLLDK